MTGQNMILVTRPQRAALTFAARLQDAGFSPFVEPLLMIKPGHEPPPGRAYQAVFITSANVFENLAAGALEDLRSLPCFCVGAATAEAAQRAGFRDARKGDSDSLGLAKIVRESLSDHSRPILHICGAHSLAATAAFLQQAGFAVDRWRAYRAEQVEGLTPELQGLFRDGRIAAIPLFSPRSAQILIGLLRRYQLSSSCAVIDAVALSDEVAAVLRPLNWRSLRSAAQPREQDIIDILTRLRIT